MENKMLPYMMLVVAIIAEVAATSALKLSDGFTRFLPSVLVVAGYGASFYCLSISLRTLQVGFTYPIWCGVGIVMISGIAVLFLGEKIDLAGIMGMAFIIAGVMILSIFSDMGSH